LAHTVRGSRASASAPETSPDAGTAARASASGEEAGIELIDPRQLRHFLAVVENAHFSRAARQLGISKQRISQSIAALEKSLGVRLFERGQFGAVPTEFGRVLTRHAMVMQAEARNARTEIEGLRENHRGEITCALGSSFSEYIAPPAIRRFTEAYPDVSLRIANVPPASMLQLLSEGELDFVAMGDLGDAHGGEIERKPLFQMANNLIMAADHPLARVEALTLEALRRHPFLGVWRNDLTARTLHRTFERHGLAPPRVLESDNAMVNRGLLLDEQHLVIANRLFYERELRAGALVERIVPELGYTLTYVLFYRRGTLLGRATMALMRALQDVATGRFGDSMLQISP